tara:strand:+ start:688 stop:1347 length:660 start_codon:yes stop_codon:yes gene_type:complete
MLNGLDKIDGLTPEQIEAVNGLAGGLINKKTELEEKLSKAKGSLSAEESAQEKLSILEANIERDGLLAKENYQGALSLKEQEYNAVLEKLTTGSGEKDALIHKLLVGNGVTEEFLRYNVNPHLIGDLSHRFLSAAVVTDGKAMIGDQSLSEAIKDWTETPAGKASRVAVNNLGGDGVGGAGSSTPKQMKDMNGQERTALFQSNPVEFNRLKAEMQAQKK